MTAVYGVAAWSRCSDANSRRAGTRLTEHCKLSRQKTCSSRLQRIRWGKGRGRGWGALKICNLQFHYLKNADASSGKRSSPEMQQAMRMSGNAEGISFVCVSIRTCLKRNLKQQVFSKVLSPVFANAVQGASCIHGSKSVRRRCIHGRKMTNQFY